MHLFGRELTSDVAIIAEIGNNHEGECAVAEELIVKAAEAGVDAVKFQTFCPEHYVNCEDSDRLKRLQKFSLSLEELKFLSDLSKKLGIYFFSTPFDLKSANILSKMCPAIKISSGDNNFYPLLDFVASSRLPILLSTGLTGLEDLEVSYKTIKNRWQSINHVGEIIFMHCVSSYPTPVSEANLAAIKTLSQYFGETVGYSDHTLGNDAAVLSVALGARVIEKHFTLDKGFSDFRDHQLSANPKELKELVQRVREAIMLMGDGKKRPLACELDNVNTMRRSIAASSDLNAGSVLQWGDLCWVRPGDGYPPGAETCVIGRKLKHSVRNGQILRENDLV